MNINDSTGLGCARFEIREKHAAKGIIRVLIKNDEAKLGDKSRPGEKQVN